MTMAKFRKGDRVSIEGVIENNFTLDDDKIKVRVEPYHDVWVKSADLTMVRPLFEIGDSIEWLASEKTWTGEVLALSGEHLWVQLRNGDYATVWLSMATRVDLDPAAEAEAA